MFPFLSKIEWQGGEVFAVDYFKDILFETAKHPGIIQSITTNGLLIDKTWAQILVENTINLGYSIDTVVKQTYEKIRRGAKFEQLLKSLEIVNTYNNKHNKPIKMEIYTVVMEQNYRELYLLPEFAKEYGFQKITFELVIPFDNIRKNVLFRNKYNAIRDLKKTTSFIKNKCMEYDVEYKCNFENLLMGTQPHAVPVNTTVTAAHSKELKNNPCTLPWSNFMIEVNGDVHPNCTCDYKYSIGNLYKTGWEDIWNGKKAVLYRNYIKQNQSHKICPIQCPHYTQSM